MPINTSKNLNIKWCVISLISGAAFGILFFSVANAGIFQKNGVFYVSVSIISAVGLYGFIAIIINKRKFLIIFIVASGLIQFALTPIASFLNIKKVPDKIYMSDSDSTILVKNDNIKCHNIELGAYSNGLDTVIRFKKGKDYYQKVISSTLTSFYKINWLTECTYATIDKNGSIVSKIELGNFENNSHNWYQTKIFDFNTTEPDFLILSAID